MGWVMVGFLLPLPSLSELWFVQGDAQYGEANELIFIESVHSLNKDGGFGG